MRKIDNFTKEEIQNIFSESRSFAEVCEKLGYNKINGNNYRIVKQME